MVPPLKLTDPAPAPVPVPPQLSATPVGEATTRAPGVVGNVSENATFVRAVVLTAGFVRVKVMVEVPFTGMLAGEKALLIVGGFFPDSVCVAEAVPADPFSVGLPATESS